MAHKRHSPNWVNRTDALSRLSSGAWASTPSIAAVFATGPTLRPMRRCSNSSAPASPGSGFGGSRNMGPRRGARAIAARLAGGWKTKARLRGICTNSRIRISPHPRRGRCGRPPPTRGSCGRPPRDLSPMRMRSTLRNSNLLQSSCDRPGPNGCSCRTAIGRFASTLTVTTSEARRSASLMNLPELKRWNGR